VLPPQPGVSEDKLRTEQRHLDSQYHDFIAQKKGLDDDIKRFSKDLRLAKQRAKDYKDLLRTHDVSKHDYMEKEQAALDLEGQLNDARSRRSALIEDTKRQAYDSLAEGVKGRDASQQDALRADSHSKLLVLTAPVDGTVQQLTVHTVGGVVPAAQQLMLIVPTEDSVEIEASIENKDVGFVQESQTAEVKVDAFEYTKYGTIPGHVTHVSHDAIQDEKKGLIYSVIITMDRNTIDVDGKEVPLSAGMSVNVEIKTGLRRVIEYVLSPVLQHARESLNER
jgi:hemolysin D